MTKVNDLVPELKKIRIDRLGAQGDGVATGDDGLIYVPLTVPGDTVLVQLGAKKAGGRSARVRKLIEPGPTRVTPPCPHFMDCGGCTLQHLGDDAYGAFKKAIVEKALAHRGLGDVAVADLVTFGQHVRRRATFSAVNRKNGAVLGYHERATHRIVDIESCLLIVPEIDALITPLRALLANILSVGAKARASMTASESGIDLLIEAEMPLNLKVREALAAFANENGIARLSWSDGRNTELIAMVNEPVIILGGVPVTLPVGAFIQASSESEEALVGFAVAGIMGATKVADLFSGCGTFALSLASAGADVDAFEGDSAMVEMCRAASRREANTRLVHSTVRDLFRDPVSRDELKKYDAVVLDPPRAGARAQVAELVSSSVPTIVMISCNPASFARDARELVNGGYELELVQPFDQFLWSAHTELAATFRKHRILVACFLNPIQHHNWRRGS